VVVILAIPKGKGSVVDVLGGQKHCASHKRCGYCKSADADLVEHSALNLKSVGILGSSMPHHLRGRTVQVTCSR
jgi:hypothetical protein